MLLAAYILFNAPSVAMAAAPDAGQILRDIKPTKPLPPTRQLEENIVPESTKPAAQSSPSDDARVTVSHFSFVGNAAYSEAALHALVADAENKPLNFAELLAVVDRIEVAYKQAGFFLVQAYLPPQKIKNGIIVINVSEGMLGRYRLEGESRIKPQVIFSYLDQLPKATALKFNEVERQILLINDLAGSNAKLDLQASDEAGKTDLVLLQQLAPLITGRVELNNHGMRSTGKNRTGVYLNVNSPLKRGDRLDSSWVRSENGDLASYALNYDLPIGAQGWHFNLGTSLSQYSIGGNFSSLQANGTVRSYSAGGSYSLLRSSKANILLKLDVAHNDLGSDAAVANSDLNRNSNTNNVSASANLDWLDDWLGGGSNRAEIVVLAANLHLSAAEKVDDLLGIDGRYAKALFMLGRDQAIANHLILQAQLQHQKAWKNLDSSEKLSIGGPATLPGYANGEASGDEGTLLKLKLSWQVRSDAALGLFADYAHINLAYQPLASATNNTRHFSDAGISFDWQGKQGLTASMLLAWAGSEKPNPDDNQRPRLWANVGYHW